MAELVHVEVAWQTDPLTRPGAPAWTRLGTVDSKLLVKSLRTSRGVNIRTGNLEAGTATAVINDPNGNLDPSNGRSAWGQRTVIDGVTTNADATITSATAVFSAFDVGKAITGTGIPASTTIASINSATSAELSANATASGTGVTFTIGTVRVLPRRRIRFLVNPDDAAETVLWTGFISSLPIQWRRELQWTSLTATGITWLLSEIALPPSVLHVEMLAATPLHYWPMVETSGRTADDLVGAADGTYRRPVVESGSLVPFDVRSCPVFRRPSTTDALGQAIRVSSWTTPGELSASVWWQSDPIAITVIPSVLILSADPEGVGTDGRIMLTVQANSSLSPGGDSLGLYAFDGTNPLAGAIAVSPAPLFDGAPHHFVLTLTDAGVYELFIDGTEAPTIEAPTWDPLSGINFTTLMPRMVSLHWGWGITNSSTALTAATMGHAAVWDRVLTSSEVETIYDAGMNPWSGDLTGARLNRILDLAGVDATDRDIDTGTQTCSATLLAGANVMEYIRKIAQTEGGPVGEDAEGRIFLRERIANEPTSVATFSDDPAGDSGSAVAPLDPDFSLDRLINTARVTRENGVTQEVSAATSVATYGPKTVSLETLHQTPSGSRSAAARLTIRNHDPRLVFSSVIADAIDTDGDVMLGSDIGEAVTLIARPPRGGDPIEQISIVERVEHSLVGGESWKATFGVAEHTVLPDFWWDEPGQGWDESVWVAP